jgi:hypothetical protein
VYELEQEKARLVDENQRFKNKKRKEKPLLVPEPDLKVIPIQSFAGSVLSSASNRGHEINQEDTLQNELMQNDLIIEDCEVVPVTRPRKQMSGDEYFETDPFHSQIETTNRDLVNDSLEDSANYFMRADSNEIELQTHPIKIQKQDSAESYKQQLFAMKERLNHFERMKSEYEKLYSEFLVKSIKAQRDKEHLEKRLERVNKWLRLMSHLQCNQTCIASWLDPSQYDLKRFLILLAVLLLITFVIATAIVIS